MTIIWVFSSNPGVQTKKFLQLKLCDIALINGKYTKYFGRCNGNALQSYNGKKFVPTAKPKFAEFRITTIVYKSFFNENI